MNAYWLTYKPADEAPEFGWPERELTNLVKRFEANPLNTTEWWRISSHKDAKVGDRVYLFKQGSGQRGIFGIGTIVNGPIERKNFSVGKEDDHQVEVIFRNLVDPHKEFLLTWDQINDLDLESLPNSQSSGNKVRKCVPELEKRLAPWAGSLMPLPIQEIDSDNTDSSVKTGEDERKRALRAILLRRGQTVFRLSLIKAYGGKCVITRCSIVDVLEAAHITPYAVGQVNAKSNGLLLRADIHTLFDCGLIAIHPDSRKVVVAQKLLASPSYSLLTDKTILLPKDPADGPARINLEWKFKEFNAQHNNVT